MTKLSKAKFVMSSSLRRQGSSLQDKFWIPAFAGMTAHTVKLSKAKFVMSSSLRRQGIPAFSGVTSIEAALLRNYSGLQCAAAGTVDR